MKKVLLALGLIILWLAPAQAMTAIVQESVTVGGNARLFSLYVPDSAKADGTPLLVLLHGSYQQGIEMVRLWQADADREGIILVAPDALHNDGWRLGVDGPFFVCSVAAQIAERYHADRRRVYLTGQSGGAVFALHLSMLESRFFAATAVHAGAWRQPDDFHALAYAERKIPLAIVIGDRDQFFSISSVRHTEREVEDAGIPIEVTVIPGMDHWYVPKVAPVINPIIWGFLKSKSLDADPVYTAYRGDSQ